jgi:hypothetical protein
MSQVVLDDKDIATLRWALDYLIDSHCEIIESKNTRVCVEDFEKDLEKLERLRRRIDKMSKKRNGFTEYLSIIKESLIIPLGCRARSKK